MPLQKTNLGAPTKRCQIHRTPTPKCDPQQNCTGFLLKLHFVTEATPQTRRLLPEHSPIRISTEDCFCKENRIYEKYIHNYIIQL